MSVVGYVNWYVYRVYRMYSVLYFYVNFRYGYIMILVIYRGWVG